jgi:GAF domain-containing protein
MADHEVLHDVLRRFARTMTRRYDLSDALLEFCDHVTEVLDAAGAGVSLFDDQGDLRFVTATSEAVVVAEQVQEDAQAGPCISSVEERQPVAVTDVRDHADRWPDYAKKVTEHDLGAVLGLPLILDDERIGSMDVYDHSPRTWEPDQIDSAVVLADIAAAYVFNASELARSRRTAEQLQGALDSRVVIEQAKGVYAGQRNVSMDDAFQAIRSHARHSQRTVRDVAQSIVDDGAEVIPKK